MSRIPYLSIVGNATTTSNRWTDYVRIRPHYENLAKTSQFIGSGMTLQGPDCPSLACNSVQTIAALFSFTITSPLSTSQVTSGSVTTANSISTQGSTTRGFTSVLSTNTLTSGQITSNQITTNQLTATSSSITTSSVTSGISEFAIPTTSTLDNIQSSSETDKSSNKIVVIAGAVVGAVILLLIIGAIIILVFKRKKGESRDIELKTVSEKELFQNYVIPYSNLGFSNQIGEGHFGAVFKLFL
jgi:hypothetical protein